MPPPIAFADDLAQTRQRIDRFRALGVPRIEAWPRVAGGWRCTGGNVVLWGSGPKAVGLLTTIGEPLAFAAVVYINPVRHGRYMPGCTMPIVAPEHLREINPDIVIVMNPIYRAEIVARIAELDLKPSLFTVADPIENILESSLP